MQSESLGMKHLFVALFAVFILCSCGEKPVTERTRNHSNGSVSERWSEDSDGRKQGKKTSFYENGKVQSEANFKNGYLHGPFVMYDQQGNEISGGEFRDGEKWSGRFIAGDESAGQVVFEFYKDGKRE